VLQGVLSADVSWRKSDGMLHHRGEQGVTLGLHMGKGVTLNDPRTGWVLCMCDQGTG
jgi:hypothetical protein